MELTASAKTGKSTRREKNPDEGHGTRYGDKRPEETTTDSVDTCFSAVTTACFDQCFSAVLRASHPDVEKRELLSSLGLSPTILSAVALAIALKAAGGDVSAAKFLRDTCTADGTPHEDTNLTHYTDEELRRLLNTLQEETP